MDFMAKFCPETEKGTLNLLVEETAQRLAQFKSDNKYQKLSSSQTFLAC